MKKLLTTLFIVVLSVLTLCLCAGCSSDTEEESTTITVGASSTPHAEILEVVKGILAEEGYNLEIEIYDDYILPNTATEDGDLDANYFQHEPYLIDFNANNGTHLVSVAAIHYEPYGLYAGTVDSLENLPDGAKIAIPNDGSNEARALYLLESTGLITMKEDAGFTATKQDIAENPHNYDIVEMEAAIIPSTLDSVALAVINGNYALAADLNVNDALAVEDKASESALTYANIVVVKEGNENNEAIQALVKALQSDEVKTYIEETYSGAVVPIF